MFEKISEVLDVEHYEIPRQNDLPMVVDSKEPEFQRAEDEDFEYARQKIREAIDKSTAALDDMLDLARASEQARAYEVLNGIANSLASMSESLVKLHKTKSEGKQKGTEVSQPGVVNNNLIVSSTEDIISMLRKQREQGQITDGTN
ncbi:MAG TPA: hypothetical protein PK317_00555 [Coprothermobacter proteolyticus]|nr:hypothetical protein [Coprothermobacter proteolyticus]